MSVHSSIPTNISFEDATFNLVQALSPKKLRREDVPYDAFRSILRGFVEEKEKAMETTLAGGSVSPSNDDESSRLSSCSDSLSRFSSSQEDTGAHSTNPMRRIRTIREQRTLRRTNMRSQETVQFDCSLEEFPKEVKKLYEEKLHNELSPVKIFHVIINTVNDFLSKHCTKKALNGRVAEFVRSEVAKSVHQLCEDYDDEEKRQSAALLLDVQTSILLEIHAELHNPKENSHMSIIKKLRFLYIEFCASTMKHFMEDDMCDNFAHIMPTYIALLFEECAVTMPIDLEDAAEAEEDKANGLFAPYFATHTSSGFPITPTTMQYAANPALAARLDAMLEEAKDEEEPPSGGRTAPSQSSQTITRKNSSQGPVKRKAPPSTPTRDSHKRSCTTKRVFVPETPDEKNQTPKKSAIKDGKNVVLQTPIEKMARARRSIKVDKLAALVEDGRKSTANSPALNAISSSRITASSRLSASAKVGLARRSSLRSSATKKTTREEFLSANREPRDKKPKVKVNLATKFASTPVGETKKKKEQLREKEKEDNDIQSLTMDTEAIAKYRARMREVHSEGRMGDPTEVFYGRMSNRVGLFEDREEEKEVTVKIFNRSGRMVYSPSCVFVAHTLLNTHNAAPLIPTRPSSSSCSPSQFKLNRLVRPASKGDRLKLKKLRDRVLSPKKESKEATK